MGAAGLSHSTSEHFAITDEVDKIESYIEPSEAMKIYLTREQIHERIKAQPRPSNYLTREQIRQRIQELAITNPPKRLKNAVWG